MSLINISYWLMAITSIYLFYVRACLCVCADWVDKCKSVKRASNVKCKNITTQDQQKPNTHPNTTKRSRAHRGARIAKISISFEQINNVSIKSIRTRAAVVIAAAKHTRVRYTHTYSYSHSRRNPLRQSCTFLMSWKSATAFVASLPVAHTLIHSYYTV